MKKRITVHRIDPRDKTVLATIHPEGAVTGTDDPALLRTIQEALADPAGDYDPRLRAFVPGPASRYDSQSMEWAACVQNALFARGLTARAIGYQWRKPARKT